MIRSAAMKYIWFGLVRIRLFLSAKSNVEPWDIRGEWRNWAKMVRQPGDCMGAQAPCAMPGEGPKTTRYQVATSPGGRLGVRNIPNQWPTTTRPGITRP